MPDLTRKGKNFEKKSASVSSAEVTFEDLNATDVADLFNIPVDALITATHVVVHEAADALATLDVGTTDGGAELINDADIATVGVVTDALAAPVSVEMGALVNITPSTTLTQGRFTVVVEYVEYELSNGEQTRVKE